MSEKEFLEELSKIKFKVGHSKENEYQLQKLYNLLVTYYKYCENEDRKLLLVKHIKILEDALLTSGGEKLPTIFQKETK